MSQELTIVTHAYDLRLWTLRHTEKFPRSQRHELGRRIETKMHELFDLLIEAKFTSQKAEFLRQAALRVEDLRFLFRTAKDLHLLSVKSQGYAVERLQEIGRQLGGWRRKVEAK
ncbi:MAG TPA: diversity-generating retroelement protein Avd [Candidatus Anammoximicrobium sp.]|nr:diversity-generating retroelement protein Avd [Candidatus Anammoximicrobium sp.]